jgi:hypothetical protein
MFQQVKDLIKVYLSCFNKGNYGNIKKFQSLIATITNLSKNEITRKRKLKYITKPEMNFYANFSDEGHSLALVNFLLYLSRKGCMLVESPKDVAYDLNKVRQCQGEKLETFFHIEHMLWDKNSVIQILADPISISEYAPLNDSMSSNKYSPQNNSINDMSRSTAADSYYMDSSEVSMSSLPNMSRNDSYTMN